MKAKSITFAANHFTSKDDLPFSPVDYSKLKFGSDKVARKFGYELADAFFARHSDILLTNRCVVIPSPYNHVPNAATIMAQHFFNRLNQRLVAVNGEHAEWSIIHRKVSYISDYGFIPAEKRKALIDGDSFFLNKDFIKDKLLICIDDVRITGTHEKKLVEVLAENGLDNPTAFLYFAQYEFEGVGADIEAYLNFAGINNLNDYVKLSHEPNHHIIVRPMKYLLSRTPMEFEGVLENLTSTKVMEIYNSCIAEGFYRIPAYQTNFQILTDAVKHNL